MSDETTPRPWRVWPHVHPETGRVEFYAVGPDDDERHAIDTQDPDAADLIVTAVNQHDALVAFVERVRDALRAVEASRNAHYSRRDREKSFEEQGWRQGAGDALNSVRATFYPILADLDAQIGGN